MYASRPSLARRWERSSDDTASSSFSGGDSSASLAARSRRWKAEKGLIVASYSRPYVCSAAAASP
eukprot:CAMPEP_0202763604 /NCGR_PEP_ID=MMETSP1388-20130828/23792_1 /ASSEMBLY_ACC=CAM_ASM_000864 /TAXON_ID=37098 /ORGANISM="Isochrysis sp, Strain CCMP1244" /LENGTH=64 /DNA_ID=CAMNT_0049431971 /DNA_START=209 /DNA_END=400 /DNA_ORIENTATION=-